MTIAVQQRSAPWVRHIGNAAPAVGFLAVLLATHDFRLATWALVGLSILALGLSLAIERRIAPIPAFSGGAALVFGGLSLALHRNDLLQMKMTIVDSVFGLALFGGLMFRRNFLKMLLSSAIQLPDHAWRTLTIRYGLFFFASAAANEVVRRTQTAEVWATFRVAAIAAAVLFGAAQLPLMSKYWASPNTPDPPEPGF